MSVLIDYLGVFCKCPRFGFYYLFGGFIIIGVEEISGNGFL